MLIRKGDTGSKVKEVQELLGITEDGIFGENTEKLVKEFQEKYELTVDGIVGKVTYSVLRRKNLILPLVDKLDTVVPSSVLYELPKTMDTFDINSVLRLSHFLSQCSHESANFKYTEENLNYSKEALMTVFRKYFPSQSIASQYARKPEKIANKVYSNRMGNGDEDSGDGWKYRGRGYIQLTGKYNYSTFNEYVNDNIVEYPELVSEKYALLSAGWYWHTTDLNTIADRGSSEDIIVKITRRVNGGTNGLDDRIRKFKRFFNILNT